MINQALPNNICKKVASLSLLLRVKMISQPGNFLMMVFSLLNMHTKLCRQMTLLFPSLLISTWCGNELTLVEFIHFFGSFHTKKLIINVERNHLGMLDNDVCTRCSQALETIMHVLSDCDVTHSLLENFITMDDEQWNPFLPLGFLNGLSLILH